MKHIVQFSGGKDSTATLIWCLNTIGRKNLIAVFCDTGHEAPQTYDYIDYVIDKLKIPFITLSSGYSLLELAEQQKMFPNSQRRWCTDKLKIRPFTDWVLDELKQNFIVYQGIRAEESRRRAAMKAECQFWDLANKKMRIYRITDVREFKKKYDDSVRRPLFNWSAKEVVNYIHAAGIEMNPLYMKGMKRVGCFPCIMSSQSEVRQMHQYFPEALDPIRKLEKMLNAGFFEKSLVPESKRTGIRNGSRFSTIDDIISHVTNDSLDMFADTDDALYRSCVSFYNLCE